MLGLYAVYLLVVFSSPGLRSAWNARVLRQPLAEQASFVQRAAAPPFPGDGKREVRVSQDSESKSESAESASGQLPEGPQPGAPFGTSARGEGKEPPRRLAAALLPILGSATYVL